MCTMTTRLRVWNLVAIASVVLLAASASASATGKGKGKPVTVSKLEREVRGHKRTERREKRERERERERDVSLTYFGCSHWRTLLFIGLNLTVFCSSFFFLVLPSLLFYVG